MSQNTTPAWSNAGVLGNAILALANTRSDGVGNLTTGVTMYLLVDGSGFADGALIDAVRIMCVANTAAVNTVATVIRLFSSTVTSGATTAADTFLFDEIAVPIISAASATLAQNRIEIPVGWRLPAGRSILASTHIAAASNTFWNLNAYGGKY